MINSKFFEKYFCYLSPSDMYKALNKTTGSEKNKAQVKAKESRLCNLMEAFKCSPTIAAKK